MDQQENDLMWSDKTYCGHSDCPMKSECQENDLMWSDKTYCGDSDCPMKSECQRYYAGEGIRWQFVNSPRKGDTCDMLWGKTQDSIARTLEEVMGK